MPERKQDRGMTKNSRHGISVTDRKTEAVKIRKQ